MVGSEETLNELESQLKEIQPLISKTLDSKIKEKKLWDRGRGYKAIYKDYKWLVNHHNQTHDIMKEILEIFVSVTGDIIEIIRITRDEHKEQIHV